MAQTREKMIANLNQLGKEWYSIDRQTAPADKKKKFMEISELVFKVFTPAYFNWMGTVNARDSDSMDKKLNILFYILFKEELRRFDPSVSSLYGYIEFCFLKRYKKNSPSWKYSFESVGSKIDWNTVEISTFTYTDDEGNEMDWESYLATVDRDFESAQTLEVLSEMEVSEKLNIALTLMAETFMLNHSAKKLNDRKRHIFQLLYSSNLINIAKLQVPRKGLQHEREVIASSNQRFFVFCYDSDRKIYVTFNELESTPLKTNRTVYELAESCGRHYTLKDNLADNPISVPIPSNICIMYLVCMEGHDITDSMFSQYRKQFMEQLERIKRI